jgi:hypothetical protein
VDSEQWTGKAKARTAIARLEIPVRGGGKGWIKGLLFYGKGSLTGLRGWRKGWSIGLQFFEHITLQVTPGSEQVATTVPKSGHGLYGITPKVGKYVQIRANLGLFRAFSLQFWGFSRLWGRQGKGAVGSSVQLPDRAR